MTRRWLLLRSLVLTLALVAFVDVQPALAKFDCNCEYGTVVVDPGVWCKFKICFETVGGASCEVVGPGSNIKFKCVDQVAISLVDCWGNQVYLTDNCNDNINVPVGPGCCVSACVGRDSDGCLVVKISPSPLDFCPC